MIPQGLRGAQRMPKDSYGLQRIPIPKGSTGLLRSPENFKGFLGAFDDSYRFLRKPGEPGRFRRIP
eukprot:2855924-Pyramimonas_sp.AAC.1